MRRLLGLTGVMACLIGASVMAGGGGAVSFRFDGDVRASGSLRVHVEGSPIDAPGDTVHLAQPRFAPPSLVAPPAPIEIVRQGEFTRIFGSGVDSDDLTPLLMVAEMRNRVFDVFYVADDDLLVAEATGAGRNRILMVNPATTAPDLMRGAVPNRAYKPFAGAVCHGLLVVSCSVYERIGTGGQAWKQTRIALLVSQDRGLTWSVHYEDEQSQVGADRGREWCMQNWWPLDEADPPGQAWFACADYIYRSSGCLGGRVSLFRARRDGPGLPWTLDPGCTPLKIGDVEGQHVHTAAVVPFGPAGVRVLASVGDGSVIRRVITATRPDADRYWAPGWTVREDYFGSLGTRGSQFVGCAPGSNLGEVIVGADENCDQIGLIVPDDDPDSRGEISLVHGFGFDSGLGSRAFVIRTAFPERGGPYTTAFASGHDEFGKPSTRVLYSPDSRAWAEIFAPGIATGFSTAIHGGHVYIDSCVDAPSGLRRLPIPAAVSLRPILVGAGGTNRAVSDPPPPATGNVFEPLTAEEVALLDPPPPAASAVYRFARNGSSNLLIGRLWPAGQSATFPAGPLHVRLWAMLEGHEAAAFNLRAVDGTQISTLTKVSAYTPIGAWFPLTFRVDFSPRGPDEPYPLAVELRGDTDPEMDVFQGYIAVENVTTGVEYPASVIPPASASLDERVLVCGFEAGDEWAVAVAGESAADLWDSSTKSLPPVVLASVVSADGDALALLADAPGQRISLRRIVDGASSAEILAPAFWKRGGQFRACISQRAGTVECTVFVGSGAPIELSLPAGLDTPPTSVRLADRRHGIPAPFAWHGGIVEPGRALDAAERVELLSSPALLDPPAGVAGDVNGDGAIDFRDLNIVLGEFDLDGPCLAGDADNDEHVGFDDLNLVLSSFNTVGR